MIGRNVPRSSGGGSADVVNSAAGFGSRITGNSPLAFNPASKKFHVDSPSSDRGSSRMTARWPNGCNVRTTSVPAVTICDSGRGVTFSVTAWCPS